MLSSQQRENPHCMLCTGLRLVPVRLNLTAMSP